MIISFKNNTSNTIIIELDKKIIEIKGRDNISVNSESTKFQFNCYINQYSTFVPTKLASFVIRDYNFVLKTSYDVLISSDNAQIELNEKEIYGEHSDVYKFIDIKSIDIEIVNREFAVKDESDAKQHILNLEKKEHKAIKIAKVVDVLQSFCYVGVPGLIIFFGTWYVSNIYMAIKIIVPLIIIAVCVSLLIKKILMKFNAKLEKFNNENKRVDLYVNTDSFFENKYILSVLQNNSNN